MRRRDPFDSAVRKTKTGLLNMDQSTKLLLVHHHFSDFDCDAWVSTEYSANPSPLKFVTSLRTWQMVLLGRCRNGANVWDLTRFIQ